MTLIDAFKNNVQYLAGMVAATSVVIGAFIAIDARYASAADMEKMKTETKMMFKDQRRQALEDKLFELRLKENPTATEKALIKRYEEQLALVNKEMGTK